MYKFNSYPYILAATCYVSSVVLGQKLSKPGADPESFVSGGGGGGGGPKMFCFSHHILQRVEGIGSNFLSRQSLVRQQIAVLLVGWWGGIFPGAGASGSPASPPPPLDPHLQTMQWSAEMF